MSATTGATALGDNAAAVTAVFAQAPGALQLLPSPDYGMGWLKIRDHDRIVSSRPVEDFHHGSEDHHGSKEAEKEIENYLAFFRFEE